MAEPANNILSTVLTVVVSGNTLFNMATGYLTWKLRTNATRIEQLETKLAAQQEKAAAEQRRSADQQHELTSKLVDERMRSFTHEVANVVADLKAASTTHKEFVEETRDTQRRLIDRDHEDELKHLRELQQIKLEVAKESVTKTDLREAMRDMKAEFERQCRE